MARLLLALIRAYRFLLAPWWGAQCRFTPTCSHYAMDAIASHGALHGSWLALKRVARCHPWHRGGFDPAP
jgi:putative membrane protein insertion efficiency factor